MAWGGHGVLVERGRSDGLGAEAVATFSSLPVPPAWVCSTPSTFPPWWSGALVGDGWWMVVWCSSCTPCTFCSWVGVSLARPCEVVVGGVDTLEVEEDLGEGMLLKGVGDINLVLAALMNAKKCVT